MANTWGNNGNSERLYFSGLPNYCTWWLQPWNEKMLPLGRKVITNLTQHITKQRHYFVNEVPSSQSFGFSSGHAWMWELDYKESWVPKNWCFWTVVLEKTLESPLDSNEIQKSIIKEISPEYSLEGLMLKLKLQYFGHLMLRTDSFEKTSEGDDRGWDGWMASLTQRTWVWVNSGSWWWTGRPDVLQSMGSQRDKTEWLNWTECYKL